MDDVSMMDWQATPPAAEINSIYNPGKSTSPLGSELRLMYDFRSYA